jgi:hypothetical protein
VLAALEWNASRSVVSPAWQQVHYGDLGDDLVIENQINEFVHLVDCRGA